MVGNQGIKGISFYHNIDDPINVLGLMVSFG